MEIYLQSIQILLNLHLRLLQIFPERFVVNAWNFQELGPSFFEGFHLCYVSSNYNFTF